LGYFLLLFCALPQLAVNNKTACIKKIGMIFIKNTLKQ